MLDHPQKLSKQLISSLFNPINIFLYAIIEYANVSPRFLKTVESERSLCRREIVSLFAKK